MNFLKAKQLKSPPHFCKYFTTIFYATLFLGANTHFGHKYNMLKHNFKLALVQALIVLIPTYAVAYITEQMVYTIPMLAATSFIAAAVKPSVNITRVDDGYKDSDS
jgi:hypothetical protein